MSHFDWVSTLLLPSSQRLALLEATYMGRSAIDHPIDENRGWMKRRNALGYELLWRWVVVGGKIETEEREFCGQAPSTPWLVHTVFLPSSSQQLLLRLHDRRRSPFDSQSSIYRNLFIGAIYVSDPGVFMECLRDFLAMNSTSLDRLGGGSTSTEDSEGQIVAKDIGLQTL
ncbi:hypothetical protein SISSUDRAFT_1038456 [Sistotremastrum suecicum HHB10207 ss-3]|uniref:Uncharacterized protein n=1 Tax=Sistotremastrum suecicum HHB10207 ss-3 TaxID=1314776 RepID=A0A165WQ71_9AGAM|nr:hypothetical protein SISSUDRAFT_1038456 [Sistotremastrum suecicum HHB10207 ss-3]